MRLQNEKLSLEQRPLNRMSLVEFTWAEGEICLEGGDDIPFGYFFNSLLDVHLLPPLRKRISVAMHMARLSTFPDRLALLCERGCTFQCILGMHNRRGSILLRGKHLFQIAVMPVADNFFAS